MLDVNKLKGYYANNFIAPQMLRCCGVVEDK